MNPTLNEAKKQYNNIVKNPRFLRRAKAPSDSIKKLEAELLKLGAIIFNSKE